MGHSRSSAIFPTVFYRVYCTRFGVVEQDVGIGSSPRGQYVARDAAAPVACPLP